MLMLQRKAFKSKKNIHNSHYTDGICTFFLGYIGAIIPGKFSLQSKMLLERKQRKTADAIDINLRVRASIWMLLMDLRSKYY